MSVVSGAKIKLKKLKTDDVHDIYKPNVTLDEEDARIAMRTLRDSGVNVIIIPGENGVIKIRKGFNVEGLEERLEKALNRE